MQAGTANVSVANGPARQSGGDEDQSTFSSSDVLRVEPGWPLTVEHLNNKTKLRKQGEECRNWARGTGPPFRSRARPNLDTQGQPPAPQRQLQFAHAPGRAQTIGDMPGMLYFIAIFGSEKAAKGVRRTSWYPRLPVRGPSVHPLARTYAPPPIIAPAAPPRAAMRYA